MIDAAPEVVPLAVDADEHLVEMPAPLRKVAHGLDSLPADLASEHGAEPVPPKPDRLMANIDSALGQQIFDLTERKRETDVHHDDGSDHLRRAVEPSKRVVGLRHIATLSDPIGDTNRLG